LISEWLVNQWEGHNLRLKKLLFLLVTVTLIYLAWILGPAFTHLVYALTVGALLTGYLLFPDQCEAWFDSHEPKLIGAAFGFFFGGSIAGLVLGTWLGYYCQRRYEQLCNRINTAQQYAAPVLHPIETAKRQLHIGWEYVTNLFKAPPTQTAPPAQTTPTSQVAPPPQTARPNHTNGNNGTRRLGRRNTRNAPAPESNASYLPRFNQTPPTESTEEDVFFDCHDETASAPASFFTFRPRNMISF
jgi:hypothetical protein